LRERIQTLDGLRFLAALGVLWIHIWTMFGNPVFYIGKVNIANLLAIGGNGVDLFFVISGFCMYFFYASKTQFSYTDFGRFIKKRWFRLSPAFYAAAIFYIINYALSYGFQYSDVLSFLTSVFYLNAILPTYNPSPHFWTLSVEWQFYFTIPFLLIYQFRHGFTKVFFYIYGTIFLLGLISIFILKGSFDLLTNQIFFRGIEFAAGIVAARILLNTSYVLKYRAMWLFISVLITYCGRVLISKFVLDLSSSYYNLFKLFGFGLMGCGFAGILYLSVTSTKWLNKLLGNNLFKTMGRISYSFYLWHGLVARPVTEYMLSIFTSKALPGAIVATLISAAMLYPVSLLSYRLLEKPFLSIGNLTTR